MTKKVHNQMVYRALSMFTCALLVTGCVTEGKNEPPKPVDEIYPGILQGYLATEMLPDSLALVPPPPSENSSALALDKEVSLQSLTLHDTARWKLATQDADLEFPQAAGTFSCALNAPITEQETPHLYMLLRRTVADAGLSTYTAKNAYSRTRPFVTNKAPTCTPEDEGKLREDGSYPSGHTAVGWAWALILAEISPQQSDAILARGWAFGQSRTVCNVHWQSDVTMGRVMGAAAVAKLHAEPEFKVAVEAAKQELDAVRAKGLKPTRECQVETEALTEDATQAPWPANNTKSSK